MTISVIDSAAAMTAILDGEEGSRADGVRAMWSPMRDMYRFVPGQLDLEQVHRQNFGFPVVGATDVVRGAVDRLAEHDAWNRLSEALIRGADTIAAAVPGVVVPDLTVLLVVGDPTNAHFMDEVRGLSAFGGISGFIVITVWPTDVVLDRLEAIAVHELHHNVRYAPGGIVWDPQSVTVGEQVVAEGLADHFAVELYGDLGYTHFVSQSTRDDYAVVAKVASGLDVTGMQNFTAWIHGDAAASLFGTAPVGVPTGAGYAAGERIVSAYLEANAVTAAQSVHIDAGEVIGFARETMLPR
ncbi:DUF2268 domain-containing protein [Gordonia malaquae]|uniref:DUF2268 domain-containing protein n=1 Tax=Gordonia malaquae TaxID=410332 RepID=UPI0030FE87E1